MEFNLLPSLTPFVVGFVLIAAVAVVAVLAESTAFFAANRKVRIARREPLFRYYGHLVTGH